MMKKSILLLSFLLCVNSYAGVYTFKSTKSENQKTVETIRLKGNQLEVRFSIKSLTTSKSIRPIPYNDEFVSLKVDGLESTHKIGAPELPIHSMILEGMPSDFKISLIKGEEYNLDVTPAPYQKAPCRCAKSDKKNEFSFVSESFENSGRLVGKLTYLGDFKGRPLSHLSITPFQYKENEGLFAYPNLKVFIENKKTITSGFEFSNVLNQAGKRYVIFSPNEYHSVLDDFINHKRNKGFEVELISMESLGNDFNSIKNSIHKMYKKRTFDYALIVGHEHQFPTNYVTTSNDPKTPSDLGYFTMGGSSDEIPDVFYGRLTVSSAQDVKNQVSKILEYENRTWSDSSGLSRMIGIASDEGYKPSDVEYTNSFTAPFKRSFSTDITNVFQANQNSTPETINQVFNQGVMWVNYIGHGSGPSWISVRSREYTTEDIKNINPGKVKPVIIDVACQNGRFSLDNRLGERFMNESKAGKATGAVAFFGGSVDVSWHPPAVMARGVSEIVAGNPNQTLGEVLLAGQLYLIQNYDDRNASTENLRWYHLQGDPTLALQVK